MRIKNLSYEVQHLITSADSNSIIFFSTHYPHSGWWDVWEYSAGFRYLMMLRNVIMEQIHQEKKLLLVP